MSLRHLACLLPLLWTPAVQAMTLEQLQAAGQLQLSSALQPATDIVPRQKLALVLEVATDRWFAGGTRIRVPEVPGLVILQTEQFAANASEYRDGRYWVVQRWTLDVYARRAGDFRIPPVTLELQVNHAEAGVVSGNAQAPAVDFTAALPAGLEEAAHWVAAPRYRVTQHFDRELQGLAVGDAVEREIRFEADDVMAMMLPEFSPGDIDGLSGYPDPPVLQNRRNRGVTNASRVQRITYVLQAPGSFTLPAQDFYWWDTVRGELSLLTLPAVELQVEGAVADSGDAGPVTDRRQWLAGPVAVLLVVLLLALLWRWRPWHWLRRALQSLWQGWQRLRRPALPARLNPGSNAAD